MVLNFEEYTRLNEGVQSVVTLADALNALEPFGWTYKRGDGDSCKLVKGKYVVYFHLRHDASADRNRTLDVGGLDILRGYLIDEFNETGNLETIKAIDWKYWRLPDPLKRELKNIDPETGKPFEVEQEQTLGHKLQKARVEKDIRTANEKYKDAQLYRIDDEDENSCFIMMSMDEKGLMKYNTCRADDDRRPILKTWIHPVDYEKRGDKYYFGRDDMRSLKTKFYEVLPDGTLDKVVKFFKENKNVDKNLEML